MSKELNKTYDPKDIEDRLYKKWEDNGYFHAEVDRSKKPFTIVMPPPNITGQLHMGHALDNTMQDILIRYKRMQGYNALWQPGTDHASIATEVKVIQALKEQGINKADLTREEFLEKCWDWRKEYGGRIVKQLRKLGSSADWQRERFTMDEGCSHAVQEVFTKLYKKGWIYKGSRIVNWCPVCKTSISDAEVEHEEQDGFFWHINYPVVGEEGRFVEIATTRPETLFGDTAVAVNPDDERYQDIIGKTLKLPCTDREIPVIADSYVDKEFGTGCVKITPAHDPNDFEVGKRHSLEEIVVINDDATMNEKAGKYAGMDRYECRKALVEDLKEQGLLVKVVPHSHNVGVHDRCHTTVEPMIKQQWFVKMDEMIKPAVEGVKNGEIKLLPSRMDKTYFNWTDNIRDWCISRQLWWGQRIPAYYLPDGQYVVESTPEAALEAAKKIDPNITADQLRQDEDVLDTWFSSWLWPISVFDAERPGHPEHTPNKDLAYYYPTNDLVTGPDILFFWVARMIMAGDEFMGKEPFHNVYLTGIVRDKLGRKMSKTLGNSPDPLDLIAKYGADAVRIGMLLCASAGNDIFYDESQIEQGRNFCGKIWNSYRLVKGWTVDENAEQPEACKTAVNWFKNKMNQTIETVEDHYSKFRISDALMSIYKLFWDDYCSWYLELIKPAYGQPIDKATYTETLGFFEALLKMIHPVMPFITEELWQDMAERKEGETIMFQSTPKAEAYDAAFISSFELAEEAVNAVRSIRQQKNISPKEALQIKFKGEFPAEMIAVVSKLANASSVELVSDFGATSEGVSMMVRTVEMYVPLTGKVNVDEEIAKLEAELKYQREFLESVRKKLSNERFTAHAPEKVVAIERKKEADSLSKIESYEAQLKALKSL